VAFLSLLDDRARPKGSRDPLGFELIWSYFGRRVIGNLTTITSSMDNFAVAILGFYWANQIVEFNPDESVRQKKIREFFLRYEQLTGYIRYYGNASDIMGITRIKSRILEEKNNLTLGMSADEQILSDQASYGLWGLYSTAARDTKLVMGSERKVTELGERIAASIINQLGTASDQLLSMLNSEKVLDRQTLQSLGNTFIRAIHHSSVQESLLEALMSGGDVKGVQNELWNITRNIKSQIKEQETVPGFLNMILEKESSDQLRSFITDIQNIERLLVALNNIFHYCRRKDGEKLDVLLKELNDRYSYSHLPDMLPELDFPRRDRLSHILDAIRANDNSQVINSLLSLNKEVMQQRSGAPWVELEAGKTLRVKVKSETSELRSQEDIENKWDYDYFLGSFLNIAKLQLGQA